MATKTKQLAQFALTELERAEKTAHTSNTVREAGIILLEENLQDAIELIKKGEYAKVNKIYPKLADLLTKAITEMSKDMSQLSRAQMTGLVNSIAARQRKLMDDALAAHTERIKVFAGFSYQIEASMVHKVTGAALKHAKRANTIYQDALKRPIGATGDLLEPFIRNLTASQVGMVEKILRKANANRWTSQQTVQVLKGTRANQYTDGLMSRLGKQTATVVRTAMQHINNSARQTLWAENADIVEGYKWVSTLDDRTSEICIELDGQVFKIDEGPIPPAHPNCRSTTVAVLDKAFDLLDKGATRSSADGYIPADMTYKEWEEMHEKIESLTGVALKSGTIPDVEGLFNVNSRAHADIYKSLPRPLEIPPAAQKILDRMDFIESINLTDTEHGWAIQFPSNPDGLKILDSAVDGLIEMHERFPAGMLKLENLMDADATSAYLDDGSNRLAFNVNFFEPGAWKNWVVGRDPKEQFLRSIGVYDIFTPDFTTANVDDVIAGLLKGGYNKFTQTFIDEIGDAVLRERAAELGEVLWNVSNSPKSTMYHEYGHHLARTLRMKAIGQRAFATAYRPLISMYGASSYAELIAESVSLYMQGDTSQYWRIHPEILARLQKADKLKTMPFKLGP